MSNLISSNKVDFVVNKAIADSRLNAGDMVSAGELKEILTKAILECINGIGAKELSELLKDSSF